MCTALQYLQQRREMNKWNVKCRNQRDEKKISLHQRKKVAGVVRTFFIFKTQLLLKHEFILRCHISIQSETFWQDFNKIMMLKKSFVKPSSLEVYLVFGKSFFIIIVLIKIQNIPWRRTKYFRLVTSLKNNHLRTYNKQKKFLSTQQCLLVIVKGENCQWEFILTTSWAHFMKIVSLSYILIQSTVGEEESVYEREVIITIRHRFSFCLLLPSLANPNFFSFVCKIILLLMIRRNV